MPQSKNGVTVRFKNVSKSFRDNTVVRDITLEVRSGEFLILLGPSGCGKTTMLRMLAGLEIPTHGDIFIDDVNVNTLHPKERDIAMVFQNYALYPHMSMYENLSFPLEAKKIERKRIHERIMEVAEILAIADLLKRKPKELSGGEAQRVALGRAIIREPRVFLMDEPLSNLDAKLRIEMRDELLRLHRRLKVTTIYVTHDQEEAMALGDRLAVFRKGELQQIDTPQVIYEHPENRFVAEFIGNPKMNIFSGVVDEGGDCVLDSDRSQSYRLPSDRTAKLGKCPCTVLVGVRPEDISISLTPRQGAIKTRVDLVEVIGRELRVCVAVNKDIYTILAPLSSDLRYGMEVYIILNPNRIHLFDPETGRKI